MTVGVILVMLVIIRCIVADDPSIVSLEALAPPTVKNTAVDDPVDTDLLAAGSAGFQRTPWVIQPNIHTLNQVSGKGHIIVFHQENLSSEAFAAGDIMDMFDHLVSGAVCRVRLAGEDDLNRHVLAVQKPFNPGHISENQVCPLIGGKTSGKTDGKGVWIQLPVKLIHFMYRNTIGLILGLQAFPNEFDHFCFQNRVNAPQILVGYLLNIFPNLGSVKPFFPVFRQVSVIQVF